MLKQSSDHVKIHYKSEFVAPVYIDCNRLYDLFKAYVYIEKVAKTCAQRSVGYHLMYYE